MPGKISAIGLGGVAAPTPALALSLDTQATIFLWHS